MPAPTIFLIDSEKTAKVPNGQIGVPLPFSTWSSIRIGLRFALEDTGANLAGTPRLIYGLTSGSSNWFADPSCAHFVGVKSRIVTWTRSVLTNNIFLSGTNMWQPLKKIGVTETNASGVTGATTYVGLTRSGLPLYGVDFLHITKGSPNYTLQTLDPSTSNAAYTSITETNFLNLMESEAVTTSISPWGTLVYSTAQTLAVDEVVDGTLDHLFLSWDRSSPALLLADIAVARLA